MTMADPRKRQVIFSISILRAHSHRDAATYNEEPAMVSNVRVEFFDEVNEDL